MISKPNLSIWQMFALCMGAFGIQFCFALPQANATRIFQNLGASLEIIPLLWLAGPITGLIVQPLVGYYSDRTRTRIGRRRPYFLVGAALAAVMLIGWVEFEAESAVDGLMMRKIPFDGIVAASDLIALGGIRALHRAGVDVPRDVSVVGYDNNLLSRLSTPTLSTVQQDIAKAGRMLVSKLVEWSGQPRPEMLSTGLIVRESCGA